MKKKKKLNIGQVCNKMGKLIQWTCGGEMVKYFCSTFGIVTPWLKLKT